MNGSLTMASRRMMMVCCGAGGPPANFLTPHSAKTPGGHRRHECLAFLGKSEEFHFAASNRREEFGIGSLLLSIFALLVALLAGGCGKRGGEKIVVGSKNFTEQIVLAELFAQQIEAHSALRVERRLNLGGTFTVSYTHLTLPTICSV